MEIGKKKKKNDGEVSEIFIKESLILYLVGLYFFGKF